MRGTRDWLTISLLSCVLLLSACGDTQRPDSVRTTPPAPPANTAAPVPAPAAGDTASPSPDPAAPVVPADAASAVDARTGPDGVMGGAPGADAPAAKPDSGTVSGSGADPAVSSGERSDDKK